MFNPDDIIRSLKESLYEDLPTLIPLKDQLKSELVIKTSPGEVIASPTSNPIYQAIKTVALEAELFLPGSKAIFSLNNLPCKTHDLCYSIALARPKTLLFPRFSFKPYLHYFITSRQAEVDSKVSRSFFGEKRIDMEEIIALELNPNTLLLKLNV